MPSSLAVVIIVTVGAILYGEYLIKVLKTDAYIDNDIFGSMCFNSLFALMLYLVVATLYHYGVKEGRETSFFSIGALVTTLLFC